MPSFMKVLQFVFTFLSCTYISVVSAQVTAFPACATHCAKEAANVVKCPLTDASCLCGDSTFSINIWLCARVVCTTAAVTQLEKALNVMCSSPSSTTETEGDASTSTESTTTTSASSASLTSKISTSTSSTSSSIITSITTTFPTTSDTSASSFSPSSTSVVVETVVVAPTSLASSGAKLSPFLALFDLFWIAFFSGCYILLGPFM